MAFTFSKYRISEPEPCMEGPEFCGWLSIVTDGRWEVPVFMDSLDDFINDRNAMLDEGAAAIEVAKNRLH